MDSEAEIYSVVTKSALCYNGGNPLTIANIIHLLFKDNYRTVNLDGKIVWYKKSNDDWITLSRPDLEINTFREKLFHYNTNARLNLKMPDERDPEYENKYKSFLENMPKLLKQQEHICNRSFMGKVIKELEELFLSQ